MMNAKGQCCGTKPIVYKRTKHLFCCRCNRAYDLDTKVQISNWAWKRNPAGDPFYADEPFVATYPKHEYARRR
jgi:hypothetical protein